MKPPAPKLKPGTIYSSDNGRLICVHCAGQSALYTGRDISGQRVTAIPRSENAAWKAMLGKDMACEGGCTSYSDPSPIISQPSTPPTMTPPSIPFAKGQAFTLIAISSMMAHTTKEEVVITSLLDSPVFRPRYFGSSQGSWRFGTIKFKGKRKEYYLDVSPETIVLAGHGVALVDSDVRLSDDGDKGFSGNACFNLCGTVEEIRQLITGKNLNPAFTKHDAVIVIPPGDEARTWYDKRRETPAFPEVDTHHAVVQRIRDAQPVAAEPAMAPASHANAAVFADF